MKALHLLRAALAASVVLAAGSSALAADTAQRGDPARGKYLVGLMSCSDCHTPGSFSGKPDMSRYLAGSDVGFAMPGLGYFYGPNLTPDKKTGLGDWSQDQIVAALRTGARPDGRQLAPIMPWQAFATLTDEDADAIAAYLKSLPPMENKVSPPTGWGETPPAPYQAVVMPPAK